MMANYGLNESESLTYCSLRPCSEILVRVVELNKGLILLL